MPAAKQVTFDEPVKCHFCFEKAYTQWGETPGCASHLKEAKSRGNGSGTKKTKPKAEKTKKAEEPKVEESKEETPAKAEAPSESPTGE